MDLSDAEFEKLILEAVDKISPSFKARIENIAFITADEPTIEQRQKLKMRDDQTLLGLYEGVPLPSRGGSTKVLPDKITLFKLPLLATSHDLKSLRENVRHTIWHEVAHYFGLDHTRIHELEK